MKSLGMDGTGRMQKGGWYPPAMNKERGSRDWQSAAKEEC